MLIVGKYLYIESSAPRVKGDKARLVTSTFPAGRRCLQFYYHMKGRDIGSLTVYTKETGQSLYPQWTKKGAVGDDWNLGLVNINTKKPYQVCYSVEAYRNLTSIYSKLTVLHIGLALFHC